MIISHTHTLTCTQIQVQIMFLWIIHVVIRTATNNCASNELWSVTNSNVLNRALKRPSWDISPHPLWLAHAHAFSRGMPSALWCVFVIKFIAVISSVCHRDLITDERTLQLTLRAPVPAVVLLCCCGLINSSVTGRLPQSKAVNSFFKHQNCECKSLNSTYVVGGCVLCLPFFYAAKIVAPFAWLANCWLQWKYRWVLLPLCALKNFEIKGHEKQTNQQQCNTRSRLRRFWLSLCHGVWVTFIETLQTTRIHSLYSQMVRLFRLSRCCRLFESQWIN